MTMASMDDRLKRNDYLLLALICLAFFSHTLFIGRVFSLHESILPQTSREMLADGDWMIPKNGGRPWLEKPPLPQWITVGILSVVGHVESEWVYRLAPIGCGTGSVLLVAWLASLWFGRDIGWLSGLILATSWDFLRYATYAEADIFLCVIVTAALAVFVRVEWGANAKPQASVWGNRSWLVWLFFILLGLTNLAKGLLFGTAMVVLPLAGWLLWNRDRSALRRYAWLWGWLLFFAISAFWPVCTYLRHSDVVELWMDDHLQRLTNGFIGNPPWYYAEALLWIMLPWTPWALAGLWLTAGSALRDESSPRRFLWCWALLPPLVFSIPDGKHHHYLLHCLAPWAILAALGLRQAWQWVHEWPAWLRRPWLGTLGYSVPVIAFLIVLRDELPGPSWLFPSLLVGCPLVVFLFCWSALRRQGATAVALGFGLVMVLYVAGLAYKASQVDHRVPDTEFLVQIEPLVGSEQPVFVNADEEGLETLRAQFYLGERSRVLHNLTFLLDEQLKERELFLLARGRHEPALAEYGEAQLLLQSARARRETSPGDRWSLYRLNLRGDLPKKSAKPPSVMQTADRVQGPFLDRQ